MSGPARSERPTLAGIVRVLGGDLYAAGRRASIPGPGHSRADRSVSLLLAGRRVLVHCFAGDDWRAVLDDLRARGLVDAAGCVAGHVVGADVGLDVGAADGPRVGHLAGQRAGVAADPPSRAARIRAAQRLWAEARPIGGTLSERHLLGRGVAAAGSEALRHHPQVPAAVYAATGPRRPALLAAIRDVAGDVAGVEVTYLAADGRRASLAIPRKTIGAIPPGAAVRLAPAGPRLLVGEGVATCLSAAAIFRLPAWALLSTRNLRRWRAPDGVRFVLIAADRGADGERSARVLAAGLRAQGVRGVLRWPPAPHGDWNEAHQAAREEEAGRGGTGAADRMVRAAGPEA